MRRAGKDLTRESFIDALEGIRNFDTGVTFPVTYGPDRREATNDVLIVRVNDKLEWEPHPEAK